MKSTLINNAFHGNIEPIREAKLVLPTYALEIVELAVLVCVLYFIFYMTNKHVFKKAAVRNTFKEHKFGKQPAEAASGFKTTKLS